MMDGEETYSSEKKLEMYNIIFGICTSNDMNLCNKLYKDIFEFIKLQTMKIKQQLISSFTNLNCLIFVNIIFMISSSNGRKTFSFH